MRKMEMFFDYACPYCLAGHEQLKELLPKYPDIEVIWRPCEAHPRPEVYGVYSDLCIEGLLYVFEHGGDVWAYHEAMYKAACKDKANIEDPEVIAKYAADIVDPAKLLDAIRNKVYSEAVLKCNDYAFEENDVWYIPAYRMDGEQGSPDKKKKLDSVGGVGVMKEQLDAFMSGN